MTAQAQAQHSAGDSASVTARDSSNVSVRLSARIMGRLRLVSQGVLGEGVGSVPETVRWMTAMQAQDLPAALWAVGLRSSGAGLGSVRAALDDGEIVRSWPMRGTLHLVAPEDLRWMLRITTPRMIRGAATRHRQLEISEGDIKLCRDVALEMLTGGKAATRQEMFAAFEAAGQVTKEQRGVHLLGLLCQTASIVLGPLAGNQQKFAAFDEWIPESRSLEREEGIAEWVLRYMRSHGPATERDFSWWSGIPLTEVRQGLSSVESELVKLIFEGSTYWLSPSMAELLDVGVPGERAVQALPAFDEFLLGYTDRSLVLPPEHADKIVPGGNGVFKKIIVAGGQVVGTWAMQGSGKASGVVPVTFDEAKPLGTAAAAGFRKAGDRYLKFVAG